MAGVWQNKCSEWKRISVLVHTKVLPLCFVGTGAPLLCRSEPKRECKRTANGDASRRWENPGTSRVECAFTVDPQNYSLTEMFGFSEYRPLDQNEWCSVPSERSLQKVMCHDRNFYEMTQVLMDKIKLWFWGKKDLLSVTVQNTLKKS